MSYQEIAKNLIDQVPESKLYYVISFLQGVVVPDEIPNTETLEAMRELDNGGGTLYTGTTEEIFAMLESEDIDDA